MYPVTEQHRLVTRGVGQLAGAIRHQRKPHRRLRLPPSRSGVGTLRPRTSDVDGNGSATEGFSVELLDRLFTLGLATHLDETETFGLPRVFVFNDADGRYLSVLSK